MNLHNRILSVILVLAMLFALVSCETLQTEVKNTVDPKAVEAYEGAVTAFANANSYVLTFSVRTSKRVGTETFTDVQKGSAKYTDMGSDPKIMVSTSHNLGTETLYTSESFRDGRTSFSFSDEQYVYQAKESIWKFTERQLPVKLFDTQLYENIVFDPADPQKILLTAAVAPEEWLPGMTEDFGCIDFRGEGWVKLTEGSLTALGYKVTYTRGATLYTSHYDVTLTQTEVTEQEVAHDFKGKYTQSVEDVTLPYTLRYASAILNRYEQGMVRIYDEFYRKSSGKTHVKELTLISCADENKMPAMLATESSLEVSRSGQQVANTVRRKQTRGQCSVAIDDGSFSDTESDAVFESLADCEELRSVAFPAYGQFEEITLQKVGCFLLLEGELKYSAAKSCFTRAGVVEKNDPELFKDAVARSATCRIAIDTDTGFLTSARILAVASPGKNTNDLFAFLRELYVDPGNHGAYQAIFESPYPDQEPPAEEKPTPLFYKITDKEGHTAYLLGTIHTGDNRTAYLPQSIYDAFNASDALAVESNLLDFEKRLESDEALSQAYSASMFFTDGTTLESFLEYPDLYKRTEGLLFAMGYGLYSNSMKPSAAASVIESWYADLFSQFSSDKGVDMRLLKLADEGKKKIYEIEKPKDHFDALTDYSRETQVQILEEATDMKKADSVYSTLYLFELWCQGNEKLLREAVTPVLSENATPEEKAYFEEYMDKMITKRDKVMVKGIKSYLSSGETVFVAVGLAHVIGEGGIIDQLKEAGYTVTLVR